MLLPQRLRPWWVASAVEEAPPRPRVPRAAAPPQQVGELAPRGGTLGRTLGTFQGTSSMMLRAPAIRKPSEQARVFAK